MNDRRGFLKMMVGGVAATAAIRSFPFRVFSFPSEIKPFTFLEVPTLSPWPPKGWVSYRFVYSYTPPPTASRRIGHLHDGTRIYFKTPSQVECAPAINIHDATLSRVEIFDKH